ncbi:hypothetical protein BEL01nite_26070 [Bradyrhizobium elkanii]|nr:hypothetical protein BEL01nite_26070 [Bradyrhizobium elkanii]
MIRPKKPSRPINSIGNMPSRKIGSSGTSSKVSDCLRIGDQSKRQVTGPSVGPLRRSIKAARIQDGVIFPDVSFSAAQLRI